MCQMSTKLPATFDQNPPHTFDKIVKKLITIKMHSKLDLDPKCEGHSRNQKLMTWGTKNMPPINKAYRPNAHLLDILMQL